MTGRVLTEEDLDALASSPENAGNFGVCGRCDRVVDNSDPDHRVTPIVRGGRGVECKLRGDYA